MSEVEFDKYVEDLAEQMAVSYSKLAWRDQQDFDTLKGILKKEMKLGFAHLLVE